MERRAGQGRNRQICPCDPDAASLDFVPLVSPELYDEAIKDGWIVVSMKNDWKRIFAF